MYVRGDMKQLSRNRRLLPVEGTSVNLSELKLSLNNLRERKNGEFSLLLLQSVILLSSCWWIIPTLFAETSGKRKRVMSLARFFDSLQLSRPTMLYSERPSINFPPFPLPFPLVFHLQRRSWSCDENFRLHFSAIAVFCSVLYIFHSACFFFIVLLLQWTTRIIMKKREENSLQTIFTAIKLMRPSFLAQAAAFFRLFGSLYRDLSIFFWSIWTLLGNSGRVLNGRHTINKSFVPSRRSTDKVRKKLFALEFFLYSEFFQIVQFFMTPTSLVSAFGSHPLCVSFSFRWCFGR